MLSAIKQRLRLRFNRWIQTRLPEQSSVTLNQSRIFIVPTKQGLMLLVVSIGLLLLAINFEAPLNFALAFWLIAVLFVAVQLTYRNLSGVKLTALPGSLIEVGDSTIIPIQLESDSKRPRGSLELIHPSWGVVHVHLDNGRGHCVLPVEAKARGPVKLPRFRIESRYPFGLVVAWSHIQLSGCGWAYPNGIEARRIVDSGQGSSEDDHLDDHLLIAGSEDFYQLQEYAPGDAIGRLHWPSFSKDLLVVKKFTNYQPADEWLDWFHYPHLSNEDKLKALAYLAERYEKEQRAFGLKLPHLELEVNQGFEQLQSVRQALAEFGYE
ncbi:DUF58 domain-containing protein [Reinekea forsetii]|nr:DUF58 domain-containing protein [Reinekea forsetii]